MAQQKRPIDRVLERWWNGVWYSPSGTATSCTADGEYLSYQTTIAYRNAASGVIIYNATMYTGQTTPHQSALLQFLREKGAHGKIITVGNLPFRVRAHELMRHAKVVNVYKRKAMNKVFKAAMELSASKHHTMEVVTAPDIIYGGYFRCTKCGERFHLKSLYVSLRDDGPSAEYYKAIGNTLRWTCRKAASNEHPYLQSSFDDVAVSN